MRTTWLAVVACGWFVLAGGCGKRAGEPDKAAQHKPEDGVPIREVVELYRSNPAKALALYENKFTKMSGVVPTEIHASPVRTKVFDVRCSVGDGMNQYDFLLFCIQDEARTLEVGKSCVLELCLYNDASEDGRPTFFTRGRLEGDSGDKRR